MDASGATFWITVEAVLRLTRLKVRCANAHRVMPAPRKIDISVAAASTVAVVDGVVSWVVGSGVVVFGLVVECGRVAVATGLGATGGGLTPDPEDGAKILASGERRYSTGVAHSRSLTSE